MTQIQLWQIGVDAGLIAAIVFFGMRCVKSLNVSAILPRTIELESSLRSLISEAEVAGRALNDQLIRREQNLNKLLEDISAAQQRMSQVLEQAEEKRREIEIAVRQTQAPAQPRLKPQSQQPQPRYQEPEPVVYEEEEESYPNRSVDLQIDAVAENIRRTAAQQPQPRKTIDQEIELLNVLDNEPPARPKSAPASAAVKPQVNNARPAQGAAPASGTPSYQEMREIYSKAESMLREGQNVGRVSAETRIPEEQVQLLSQMIEIEREADGQTTPKQSKPTAPSDPRLGVLSGMKRQSVTL